ncbi:hypothetical protein L0F81_22280 [Streptomyces tricolor]|uniref:Uncharacterized protein n=1 Tax=Streptomyces tricolor TaxID=68277 RepID=A0ABS9JK95_9ACTN|nr:hypothetical protein [Streptomyces tricolor]MCG0065990.1 hypothetical protein [Streptomyces tricolor]
MSPRPIIDWHGNQREPAAQEVARAEAAAARVRREVAEIREAAGQLADGSPGERAVADFLRTQATLLERAGGTAGDVATLRPHQDTREQPGMLPTAARSALLIARVYHPAGAQGPAR